MTRRPNLFVIGAMKSGTTSLDAYLGAHPSIFMVPMKEPTHFVDGRELRDVSRGLWAAGYWRDRDRYLDLFADAGDAVVLGESSTSYAKAPRISGVAARIAEFNPEARIVYIMRDPIERTISHYWHEVKWNHETRDILRAVQHEPFYREVSHYALQLTPYRECFGLDRIKVLTLEALRARPDEVMRDLFGWLRVPPVVDPATVAERRNVSSAELLQDRGWGVLHRLARSGPWRATSHMVPEPVRRLGRRLARRPVDRRSVDTEQVAEFLRPFQQAEARELAQMLGREFPEWTTLYPDQPTD